MERHNSQQVGVRQSKEGDEENFLDLGKEIIGKNQAYYIYIMPFLNTCDYVFYFIFHEEMFCLYFTSNGIKLDIAPHLMKVVINLYLMLIRKTNFSGCSSMSKRKEYVPQESFLDRKR